MADRKGRTLNTASVLKASAEHGGPIALSASVAALTVALVGAGHDRIGAQPQPTPTVTVTAPSVPVVDRTTVTASPRPSASQTSARAAGARVMAAGRQPDGRQPGASITAAARPRPGAITPSGPSPVPTVQPAMCDGLILSAQVLRAACVSVGGSR